MPEKSSGGNGKRRPKESKAAKERRLVREGMGRAYEFGLPPYLSRLYEGEPYTLVGLDISSTSVGVAYTRVAGLGDGVAILNPVRTFGFVVPNLKSPNRPVARCRRMARTLGTALMETARMVSGSRGVILIEDPQGAAGMSNGRGLVALGMAVGFALEVADHRSRMIGWHEPIPVPVSQWARLHGPTPLPKEVRADLLVSSVWMDNDTHPRAEPDAMDAAGLLLYATGHFTHPEGVAKSHRESGLVSYLRSLDEVPEDSEV